MSDLPIWSATGRHGCKSSLPKSPQAWLVLGAYAVTVLGSTWLLSDRPLLLATIVVPATILLMVACRRMTCSGRRRQ